MLAIRRLLSPLVIGVTTIVAALAGLCARPFDSSGDIVLACGRWWSRVILRFCRVAVKVHMRGRIEPGKPYVFMSNHLSALDIWALFVAIPIPIRMIAKRQLAAIPFLGWAMWAARVIFVERGNASSARRSIDRAKERIRGGTAVLLFPEGTRSRDGQLKPFKKGGFHLAIDAGVPIVPVVLRGAWELMPPGSLLLASGPVDVVIGEPIPTDGLISADRNALLEHVRTEIVALLDTGRPAPPAASDSQAIPIGSQ